MQGNMSNRITNRFYKLKIRPHLVCKQSALWQKKLTLFPASESSPIFFLMYGVRYEEDLKELEN